MSAAAENETGAPQARGIGNLVVAWEIQARSWKDLDEAMKALPARLPNVSFSYASQGQAPTAVIAAGGWTPTMRHKGIGPVKATGKVLPGVSIESLLLLAGLRTATVEVTLADAEGKVLGLLDDNPTVLQAFNMTVEEVRALGGDLVGLVSKELRIEAKNRPNFFF